ncbi:MAG: lipocalin family protein [Aquaticitalea sp.]
MIKNFNYFLIILILAFGCSKNPKDYIEHLNGYWEIDEVTLPDGSKRDYNYNDTIDFINVTDSLTGFRKKMKPNLDGTYSVTNNEEHFKIKIENDSLNVYYKTPYAEWKETILDVTEDKMMVKNRDNLLYEYKRYEPINLE